MHSFGAAMNRWETFQFLCNGLQRAVSQEASWVLPDYSGPWEEVLEAASHHLVTPALGWCARDGAAMPSDVSEYLKAALFLNRERNGALLSALETALASLNVVGITPVMLKGIASLADGLYPDPGMRVLGDIDLLVPAEQLRLACEGLHAAGFSAVDTGHWIEGERHDLPMQVHAESGAGIELHRSLVEPWYRNLIDTPVCLDSATMHPFRGKAARLPDPTTRAAHNIVHSQLQDGGHWKGLPQLRQILDLAMLRRRYDGEIDWESLEHRFKRAGHLKVLTDYLVIGRHLLGQNPPTMKATLDESCLERLELAIMDPRSQVRGSIIRLALAYVGHTRARPLRVLNALRPGSWRPRLSLIGKHIRAPKW